MFDSIRVAGMCAGFAAVMLVGCSVQPEEKKVAPVAAVTAAEPVQPAPPSAAVAPQTFEECLPLLRQRAISAGVSAATAHAVLDNMKPLTRVVDLDRKQPEFSETFRRYLDVRVNAQRITQAQRLRHQHQALYSRITEKYGLPSEVLLAFWGLESNFGGYMGNIPVPASLATLACEGRRAEFFTLELIEALKLVDAGTVTAERFTGSWAGAVGNMQFMPGTYRRHAVDADGDGRADLWRSVPDAMTSAGNYLQRIGWQRDEPWGREVRLPEGFDYALTGSQTRKSRAAWARLGVRAADGSALPAGKAVADEAILLPSGHLGPAFLVGSNFEVILKWNRSEFYALSVGILSDRIAGRPALVRQPPDLPRLPFAHVRALQEALNAKGFEAGPADGILGSGTRKALRGWQVQHGMVADGYPSPEVLQRFGIGAH